VIGGLLRDLCGLARCQPEAVMLHRQLPPKEGFLNEKIFDYFFCVLLTCLREFSASIGVRKASLLRKLATQSTRLSVCLSYKMPSRSEA
jgi:hypothetical protein